MKPILPPDDADRRTVVSLCLRQCALLIDPLNGHLKSLAEELDLHPLTLSKWISDGRIPRKNAERLQRRFGKRLVDVETLVAGESDDE